MKKNILLLTVALFCFLVKLNAQWQCGDTLVDSRDGRKYATVQIGAQCWMAEHLNYGTMINSTAAGSQQSNNSIFEKYCWNNDSTYCNGTGGNPKVGGFYEWTEAVQNWSSQPALPVQGICPGGWHIPSRAEFNTLASNLGGSNVAGTAMKVGGSSGFEGLMYGYRCTISGSFRESANGSPWSCYLWVSEQSDASNAYFYELTQSSGTFTQCAYSPFYKSIGVNIRCLKNSTPSSIDETLRSDEQLKLLEMNYFSNSLEMKISVPTQGEYLVQLINITGERVLNVRKSFTNGENTFDIGTSVYPAGLYILKVTGKYNSIASKVVIR